MNKQGSEKNSQMQLLQNHQKKLYGNCYSLGIIIRPGRLRRWKRIGKESFTFLSSGSSDGTSLPKLNQSLTSRASIFLLRSCTLLSKE